MKQPHWSFKPHVKGAAGNLFIIDVKSIPAPNSAPETLAIYLFHQHEVLVANDDKTTQPKHWWLAWVTHLRPLIGHEPPVVQVPNATHEFVVVQHHPDSAPPDPRHFELTRLHVIWPAVLAVQVNVSGIYVPPNSDRHLLYDVRAVSILNQLMRGCAAGVLQPGEAFAPVWKRMIQLGAKTLNEESPIR